MGESVCKIRAHPILRELSRRMSDFRQGRAPLPSLFRRSGARGVWEGGVAERGDWEMLPQACRRSPSRQKACQPSLSVDFLADFLPGRMERQTTHLNTRDPSALPWSSRDGTGKCYLTTVRSLSLRKIGMPHSVNDRTRY
jgi:hypothetical protein